MGESSSNRSSGGARPSSWKVIRYEVRNGVATIRLDRPGRGNSWTGRMEVEFRHACATAEDDPAVGAIVITGTGRQFCVGADSAALDKSQAAGEYQTGIGEPLPNPGDPEVPGYGTRFAFLQALRKPVIAAVNGSAAGVGFVLVCFADIRFVATGAKLAPAFGRLGLPPECGMSWVLPRLIGSGRATEILLSSRIVTGEEAVAIGLATETLPAEDVYQRAHDYAERLLAEIAPTSLAATKAQLTLDLHRSVTDADADADRRLREMMRTPEFVEGARALVETRPPRFGPADRTKPVPD